MTLDKLRSVQEHSRGKIDGFMTDGKTRPPKPNEFHYRCNHLYMAASLLCSQSSGNSGLEMLSKLYLREMKELCSVEMIRLEKDFGRTICKRCKNIFIARPDGTQSITVRLNRKKQMIRTCLSCGAKKRFARNSTYLSRNEQNQHQIGIEGRQQQVQSKEVHPSSVYLQDPSL
ncbi:RNAse P Rpr2/Rpp21/SNM1 subunit domain family protein [Brugia pahangi]